MEMTELLQTLDGLREKASADATASVKAALKDQIDALETKIADLEAKAAEAGDNDTLVTKDDLEAFEAKVKAPGFISHLGEKEGEAAARTKESEAFGDMLRKGDDRMDREKAVDLQASTDASGGYSVPEELRREIIRIEHEESPLRQVCSVREAGTSDVKQLVAHGAAASGWVGETAARPQTAVPDLAQRVATFGEVYANPRAYQHVLEDSFFDVEGWLAGEVGRQFAEVSNTAFLNGDGADKPLGMLDGLTAGTASGVSDVTGAYQVVSSGVANALGATDVAAAEFLRQGIVPVIKTGYLRGAQWMMNRSTYAEIATWKDANDRFYLNDNIANPAEQRLFGFQIVINEDMDDIDPGAGASFPILFGNFARAYQIIDRTGVSVLRDPYTNKGSIMYYTRKRVGSMRLDANAIKVITVPAA